MPTTTAADGVDSVAGIEALQKLKSSDPPLYLSPSTELSDAARVASEYLYLSLKPYTPKSPFSQLLVNGFDAEQIWQQIDLQTQPLITSLRRQVRNFEKNPEEVKNLFNIVESKSNGNDANHEEENLELQRETEGFRKEVEDFEDEEIEEFDEEDAEDEEEGEDRRGEGFEDKFLKINELEEFLEEDEAREYGLKRKKKGKSGGVGGIMDEDDEEDEEGEDEDEEDEDLELEDIGLEDGEDDKDGEGLGNVRYEDFFGGKKKNIQKRKAESLHESDDLERDNETSDDGENQKKQKLSTHEKELQNMRSTIEQMEKANLEPKTWTMQGEVTATKRPKNSALEVDLDFEHNARPAPVITEEVTASLEELIQKRILEGRFDDVQKPPTLPSRVPREVKEVDENKSKKGLAEVYEEEYVQKTGLVSTALSLADQQKKEASMLFKELCSKLDALSHFHFTPKPVIEDMSIQANVPALAMEEVAPLVVSDAAMLAPEEIFAGKAVTAKKMAIKAQQSTQPKHLPSMIAFKSLVPRLNVHKQRNNIHSPV
ncbi:hypothetical protein M9H77_04610 [Catharanthus roseus]|uniref:Uncharacterized protein n=1 Tax=Catharanthus roseus TaxID=4058 RepID=A0ACC0CEW7_CATRO|nr:hypothetical protein M9H77_04610 [Catharanthus roseus]